MRVLVVEGHANLRLLYTLHFDRLGYQVIPIATCDLALVALHRHSEHTFVFVGMPFSCDDELAFVRTLHDMFPDVPVIASTPFPADVAGFRREIPDGVQACVCAPVTRDELQATLTQAGMFPPDAG